MGVVERVQRGAKSVRVRSKRRWDDILAPYLLISPFILLFLALFLGPAMYSLILSLFRYKGYGKATWVGLSNYRAILRYNVFWMEMRNVVFYWVAHTIPMMTAAFMLAVLINSNLVKHKNLLKPMIFLPQLVASVASALIFQSFFGTEYGILKPYHYYPPPFCSVDVCPPEGDPEGCFCDENKNTFNPTRVAEFVGASFDYLMTATDPQIGHPHDGNRLVQQWLWYSLATDGPTDLGHASNLVNPDSAYALTVPGQRWQSYVTAISPTVNLLPAHVPIATARTINGTDPVTVSLSAVVVNNGNMAVTGTVTVTFFSDAALTIPIGSDTLTELRGCVRREAVAATTWVNRPVGQHSFWVKVDSPEAVTESDEADNVASGMVLVSSHPLFMPLVFRRSPSVGG